MTDNQDRQSLIDAFDSVTWRKLGRWKKSFMLDCIEVEGLDAQNFARVGLACEIQNYGFVDHTSLIGEDDFTSTRRYYGNLLDSDLFFASRHAATCYKIGQELLDYGSTIEGIDNWENRTRSDIQTLFHEFVLRVSENIPFFPALLPLEEALDDRMRTSLVKHLKARGISQIRLFDYLSTFSAPSRTPKFVLKREALLRLGHRVQTAKDLTDVFTTTDSEEIVANLRKLTPDVWGLVQEYINEFGWLSTFGWIGNPMGISDAVAEIREILNSPCQEEFERIRLERLSSERAIENGLAELNASNELRNWTEIVREYSYLRLFRLDIYNQAFFYARFLFRELARHLSLTPEQLLYLTPAEVDECLISNRPPDMRLISDRKRGFAVVKVHGEIYVIEGDEFAAFDQSRHREDYSHMTEVEGEPAFKGVARGCAKVVLDSSELGKVRPGDILIAPMTNPDFTPVFGKIAGIITDEGGILCHASIIAREYKIPCIVSTRVATKVFRDGDAVLLDTTTTPGTAVKSGQKHDQADLPQTKQALLRVPLSVRALNELERSRMIGTYKLDTEVADALQEVGSKFKNLCILHQSGFRVPRAFCIPTSAFRRFLVANEMISFINNMLDELDFDRVDFVKAASQGIRELIERGKMPASIRKLVEHSLSTLKGEAFSVRSSSASEDLTSASFAGMYDTFLNVIGIADVVKRMKSCWSSLFSERSLHYYAEQMRRGRLSEPDLAIAVIVQELILSEKSGIGFTADPHNSQTDVIVIQAGYGMGEGVVSGIAATDTYVIKKGTMQLVTRTLAATRSAIVPKRGGGVKEAVVDEHPIGDPILSDAELEELAMLALKAEQVFGCPQDIEWARDRKGKFYMLQSRPITTASV